MDEFRFSFCRMRWLSVKLEIKKAYQLTVININYAGTKPEASLRSKILR